MTVLGTRPEIIRLSRVLNAADRSFNHTLVHTGQSYDPILSQVFFDEMRLREPDIMLETDTTSLGAFLGSVLTKLEPVLHQIQPDALLVLGDSNSSIASLLARRMQITVFHMEAGNRSYDENVPEEVNRRFIDHVSDINLAYTEHARRNLLAEGLHPRRVYVTGSPLGEVLSHYAGDIDASAVLEVLGMEPGGFHLASLHREENVDHPARLREILSGLRQLAVETGLPVVISTHPRTAKHLKAENISSDRVLRFMPAFGFFDYIALQRAARCVLSDSGTISEESAILGFPAVSVRDATERPEALDTGSMVLTGVDSTSIVSAARRVVRQWEDGARPEVPSDYKIENTSQRVVNLIGCLTQLNHRWSGHISASSE